MTRSHTLQSGAGVDIKQKHDHDRPAKKTRWKEAYVLDPFKGMEMPRSWGRENIVREKIGRRPTMAQKNEGASHHTQGNCLTGNSENSRITDCEDNTKRTSRFLRLGSRRRPAFLRELQIQANRTGLTTGSTHSCLPNRIRTRKSS